MPADKPSLAEVARLAREGLEHHRESRAQLRVIGPAPPPCDCRGCIRDRAILTLLPVVKAAFAVRKYIGPEETNEPDEWADFYASLAAVDKEFPNE